MFVLGTPNALPLHSRRALSLSVSSSPTPFHTSSAFLARSCASQHASFLRPSPGNRRSLRVTSPLSSMNWLRRLFQPANLQMGARNRTPISVPEKHYVLGTPLDGPFPGKRFAMFGAGCFWGVERKFYQVPGVYSTAVGYAGGNVEHPTYYEVCSERTNHAEVVRVVYDPAKVSYMDLLDVFWSCHDPTQMNRQGNDIGTQYRSVIFYYDEEQQRLAEASRRAFEKQLRAGGYGRVVTQMVPAERAPFYFAEAYHQQYLAKNPSGYCGLGGTGCYRPEQVRGEVKRLLDEEGKTNKEGLKEAA